MAYDINPGSLSILASGELPGQPDVLVSHFMEREHIRCSTVLMIRSSDRIALHLLKQKRQIPAPKCPSISLSFSVPYYMYVLFLERWKESFLLTETRSGVKKKIEKSR